MSLLTKFVIVLTIKLGYRVIEQVIKGIIINMLISYKERL